MAAQPPRMTHSNLDKRIVHTSVCWEDKNRAFARLGRSPVVWKVGSKQQQSAMSGHAWEGQTGWHLKSQYQWRLNHFKSRANLIEHRICIRKLINLGFHILISNDVASKRMHQARFVCKNTLQSKIKQPNMRYPPLMKVATSCENKCEPKTRNHPVSSVRGIESGPHFAWTP